VALCHDEHALQKVEGQSFCGARPRLHPSSVLSPSVRATACRYRKQHALTRTWRLCLHMYADVTRSNVDALTHAALF
jgi:hypothetical protein